MKYSTVSRMAAVAALSVMMIAGGEKYARAQMTDDQVVSYVKSAMAQGKSEKQIGTELLAKGVTEEQVMRIKDKYDAQESSGASITTQATAGREIRRQASGADVVGTADIIDASVSSNMSTDGDRATIFGHDVFRSRALSFEPNENTATPENYKLGPGDEIIIDIWGFNEASIRQTISPEGRITIAQIGPVYLNGLTIKQASEKIRKVLGAKYSGIDGEQPNSEVSVTLGQIRTIQINVLGEIAVPGTYRLSAFTTVFNALYRAGGVTENGSLRSVNIIRGGKQFASVDVYGFLFDGKSGSDVRLEEGDVIIVPAYESLVTVSGNVKRPMTYELKAGETLASLMEYSGGFRSDAYTGKINIIRQTGNERQMLTTSADSMDSFVIEDGDVVTVYGNLDRFSNRVEIRGYVFRPGQYELGSSISTVRQLVESAGGLTEDAFLNRAVILRQKEDLTLETVTVPLGDVMSGKCADIVLSKEDVLIVSSKFEVSDRGTLTINGRVAHPGVFAFAENTTVEDLILQAGGLLEGASLSKVEVSRRQVDSYGTEIPDVLGETFSFAIKDGLVVDNADRFVLEPYDVVSVRQSPAYQTQKFVYIQGEVTFPGAYVLQSKSERLSSVIERAGGISKYAYLHGGIITRSSSQETQELSRAAERFARRQDDNSVNAAGLVAGGSYNVGIDMEKALANPGSVDDVILEEGDRIFIPENTNVVSISGEILYPNVVVWQKGKNLNYYIKQAGGYTDDSKKGRTFVVYMNGTVDKGARAKIEPGCQIIVPKKKERQPLSTIEILSIGTSTASLATMIVSLVNMIAK